jgi:hypothetical protein
MVSVSKLGTLLAVIVIAASNGDARGGFVTSGNLVKTTPPLSVLIGDLESDTTFWSTFRPPESPLR